MSCGILDAGDDLEPPEARHQIQRLKHDAGGAIPVRRLERVAHLARCRQRQALAGHRRSEALGYPTHSTNLSCSMGKNIAG